MNFQTKSRFRPLPILAISLLLLFAMAVPASAQGIIIDPPDWPPPPERPNVWPEPISVDDQSVDVQIDGALARVQVRQIFRNTSRATVEGTYIFPLPSDAAVSDFQMTIDGETLEGKVLPADEARAIYEEIVRQQRDPALLASLGQGLFQASVFPIPPGATRLIELTYSQTLRVDGDLWRFVYPLGGSGAGLPQNFALRIELENQEGLRTLYSPSHNVSIERQGREGALIGFETSDPAEMHDFSLYFGTDESLVGVSLLSYNPAGEDGYFLLLAAPSLEAGAEPLPRDILLVLDVSGSMEGEKMEQARAAARYVVEHLNDEDRFTLFSFSTGVSRWSSNLVPVDQSSQADALDWIDDLRASGSTDINRALMESFSVIDSNAERPTYLLFLTDGLPTVGVQDPDRIIDMALDQALDLKSLRLFTFGVGYDVNTDLLDTLSRDLRGRSRYVRPEDRIDEEVSTFYNSISAPVLSDVRIEVSGARINDTYPFPLPDLFAGDQLLWAGRYEGGGPVSVVLSGQSAQDGRTFEYEGLTLAEEGGEPGIARLWATRKIGALLTSVRRNGASDEVIEEIVDLSVRFGIVTPYTSHLVLEPGMGDDAEDRQGGAAAPFAAVPADARAAVASEAEESIQLYSSADAVGEAAVQASQDLDTYSYAESARESAGVRYLAGKSFVQQGWVQGPAGRDVPFWVDTAYGEGLSLRTVQFAGEEYFTLIADPDVATWLSLSPEMVLVYQGEALRITSDSTAVDSENAPADVPAVNPPDEPTESGFWAKLKRLYQKLFGR